MPVSRCNSLRGEGDPCGRPQPVAGPRYVRESVVRVLGDGPFQKIATILIRIKGSEIEGVPVVIVIADRSNDLPLVVNHTHWFTVNDEVIPRRVITGDDPECVARRLAPDRPGQADLVLRSRSGRLIEGEGDAGRR